MYYITVVSISMYIKLCTVEVFGDGNIGDTKQDNFPFVECSHSPTKKEEKKI
jgi:hypothetical protein